MGHAAMFAATWAAAGVGNRYFRASRTGDGESGRETAAVRTFPLVDTLS